MWWILGDYGGVAGGSLADLMTTECPLFLQTRPESALMKECKRIQVKVTETTICIHQIWLKYIHMHF